MTQHLDNTEFYSGVIETFGFLIDKYNFVVSATEQEAVEFIKDDMVVEVFRESMSFMIYVQVSCTSVGEVVVLHEILKALVPEKQLTAQCNGRDSVSMLTCLKQLSQICQQNLHELLSGDKSAFHKVASSARKDRHKFTLECQYGPTRDRANVAWDSKEWDAARRLYEECLPVLSTVEKRRLDFLMNGGNRREQ